MEIHSHTEVNLPEAIKLSTYKKKKKKEKTLGMIYYSWQDIKDFCDTSLQAFSSSMGALNLL